MRLGGAAGIRLSKRVIALAAGLLLGGACFAAGWFARPAVSVSAIAYGGFRALIINAHLREMTRPYLFLAGDSYIELYPAEAPPCGLDVVNGGLSGLKTADYLAAFRRLRFERPPDVVFLAIGTNDLLAKHEPAARPALERFRTDTDQLVGRFIGLGAKVVVGAVPPIPAALRDVFDPAAIKLYSDVLAEVCARPGCRFVDPYAASRSDEFWRGREGSSRDGLHVADLRGAYRTIAAELCRSGA